MRAFAHLALLTAFFAALLAFVVFRFVQRVHDCERLGHGLVYCAAVWGGH